MTRILIGLISILKQSKGNLMAVILGAYIAVLELLLCLGISLICAFEVVFENNIFVSIKTALARQFKSQTKSKAHK
jgi:hypothetical protein